MPTRSGDTYRPSRLTIEERHQAYGIAQPSTSGSRREVQRGDGVPQAPVGYRVRAHGLLGTEARNAPFQGPATDGRVTEVDDRPVPVGRRLIAVRNLPARNALSSVTP